MSTRKRWQKATACTFWQVVFTIMAWTTHHVTVAGAMAVTPVMPMDAYVTITIFNLGYFFGGNVAEHFVYRGQT